MKKVICIIFILIGLAATNPNSGDFNDFIAKEVSKTVTNSLEKYTDIETDSFASFTGKLVSGTQNMVLERKNYYIFSTYENTLNKEKYLGICKMFTPLKIEEINTGEN